MKDLRSVPLADRYRSDAHDVAEDFYNPCLEMAVRYDRAVGYFTSGSLAVAARGVEALERSGGLIRLVASPHLTAEDVESIRKGYEYREIVSHAVTRQLDDAPSLPPSDLESIGRLGRLIAQGQLDIKIAVMASGRGIGIYHEKIGIIADGYGNQVAFTGSLNETAAAFLDNFESIQVFSSWKSEDSKRVTGIQRDFELLWSGKTPRLEVFDFPDAARRKLIELGRATAGKGKAVSASNTASGWLTLPNDIELRDYQKQAIEAWLSAEGRGIFQMATGTGKTITGLAAGDQLGRQLRAAGSPLVTLIVVPLLGLADQWTVELRKFGVTPIQCRDSWQSWEPDVADAIAALGSFSNARHVAIVVTNATFATARFQHILESIEWPILFVADEVHNLGSLRMQRCLPENSTFRLGLSATPVRHHDMEGTEALLDFFGEIKIELGIKEAIEMGTLTPYRYYPVLVPLNDEESEFYADLTKEIGKLYARARSGADVEDRLGQLLQKRANVLGHAEGKISALRTELGKRQDDAFQLVYCAQGGRPSRDGGISGSRQIDEAMVVSGSELRIPTHPYTAVESPTVRREILKAFSTGTDIRVLASMRCLDEGVDLPDARIAYMLASSSNPRQFIQRRGRVLRRAEGKRSADIIDFVAVPPGEEALYDIERSLFRRELERCIEFAQYAENRGFSLAQLRELRERYDLMDL
ncbi:DEAD/DEAH box helicase family protein [Streptomyces clavifer]|uniref:DEAD/DEAH box helicase family protein n=1 Tax=Streptomyces clavifer TaxID=68188 RepID=UPI002E81432C|nr:DEAD/DEAH box helicase family protein [Streptomyces clavifer]WUC27736.1 DEAD/DEAH box helicase family protein [Streptomyces clavifer]